MNKELLNGLTRDQISKLKKCKSVEELLNLAKAEGVKLTDEQLEAVNGGGCFSSDPVKCPDCGTKMDYIETRETSIVITEVYKCPKCGKIYYDSY